MGPYKGSSSGEKRNMDRVMRVSSKRRTSPNNRKNAYSTRKKENLRDEKRDGNCRSMDDGYIPS